MRPTYDYNSNCLLSGRDAAFTKVGYDFADLFAKKGWNLYKANEPITDWETLEAIIRQGRSAAALRYQRYILLPEVETPKNPRQIAYALQSGKVCYPFFIEYPDDKEEDDFPLEGEEQAFIIDSVMLTDELVFLQVDIDAMLYRGMWIPEHLLSLNHPCITFDILDMYCKLKQFTPAYRNSSDANDPSPYKN